MQLVRVIMACADASALSDVHSAAGLVGVACPVVSIEGRRVAGPAARGCGAATSEPEPTLNWNDRAFFVGLGVHRVEPAEQRRLEPGIAQANGFSQRRDSQPRRTFASAVRTTSAAPCPKPSAFTTATSGTAARAANSRVLNVTAARSTFNLADVLHRGNETAFMVMPKP